MNGFSTHGVEIHHSISTLGDALRLAHSLDIYPGGTNDIWIRYDYKDRRNRRLHRVF